MGNSFALFHGVHAIPYIFFAPDSYIGFDIGQQEMKISFE